MKQLIVNADDFGRSPGINRGILEAHQRGIVTSTTVMINYPAAAPGLERALTEAPDLGIGLHITLTSGRPVSAPQTVRSLLTDEGGFVHISAWPAQMSRFEPDHLQREIAAQVDRFISLAGRPPDHLDSHHHAAYLHPDALRAILDIAAGFGIPMRAGMADSPPDQTAVMLARILPEFDAATAFSLVERLQAVLAEGPAPFWPARFEMGYYDRTATLGDLLLILTTLPADSLTELMCHPGYVDEVLGLSGYRDKREEEIVHLTHAATRECVQAEGIQLISFGDLTR
ncbi:MAG: ChbG/HpnK family deacetylase [Anaerolineae bacterium]|nr:ChbG/HpnK family deacetylase [Anaerolineae bacterium]